ncbi:MAG: PHP domain-containing protein, partial [Oscillospiraceae bacterium]
NAEGLEYLAVSDHDTFKSLEYCESIKNQDGVRLIPSVELTCEDKVRSRQVHILCYYPNKTTELCQYFEQMQLRRNAATAKSIKILKEMYPCFFDEDINRYKKDSGVTFKAHLMRILMDYGYAKTVYGDEYKKLFGKGQPCLFNPPYEDVYSMLKMAKNSGGVVVFAHPSVYNSMELLAQVAKEGLIDGVEIFHPRNKQQDKEEMLTLAKKYNLMVTGGTDFHGQNTSVPVPLGSVTTSNDEIEKIINLAKQRKENN